MTPRERVITTFNRKEPDMVPKDAKFTPGQFEVFKQKTGSDSPEDYFGMDVRDVRYRTPIPEVERKKHFHRYLPNLPKNATVSELGVATIPGSMPNYVDYIHPMEKFKTISEIEEYPWPDFFSGYCYKNLSDQVKKIHKKGLAVRGITGAIFEYAFALRELQGLLMDFMDNKDFAECLLDKLTSIMSYIARKQADAGVDIISPWDDVGMQDKMIMSPETWRNWLKPCLARVIQSARNIKPDIHVFYHSDGYIEPIIPDLIEVGVTVLNPIQPECMDPVKIKKQYGSKLAFWGTIGTQSTMPFGTPEEVKEVIKERIETVGKGGGFLISPTHVLEPDVPWENIVAFFEAVEDFGKY